VLHGPLRVSRTRRRTKTPVERVLVAQEKLTLTITW
jgi:hypothetical protein